MVVGMYARLFPHVFQALLEYRRRLEKSEKKKKSESENLEGESDRSESQTESAEGARDRRYRNYFSTNATGLRAHRELYDYMGLTPDATLDEIQSRFRSLALQKHPDFFRNKSEEERLAAKHEFQRVLKAYQTLRNPKKRMVYDQSGIVS